MAKLTKEDAMKILASRQVITNPGKYEMVKVTNVSDYFVAERNQVAIANVNLMSKYHYDQAINHFKRGDYDAACNEGMSLSIRESDYKPSKGEYVNVQVIETPNKEGVLSLFIQSITPMAAKKAMSFNLPAFEDEVNGHVASAEVAVPEEFTAKASK